MSQNVILEMHRLRLVMWQTDDAALVQQLHSTIETTRYLSGSSPWTIEKAQERLATWFDEHAKQGTTKYKILSRDGRFIGRAGFSLHDRDTHAPLGAALTPLPTTVSSAEPEFELGYSFSHTEWGKGYATEIANALRDWFFERNLALKFVAYTHPDNSASQNVLTKIGMRGRTPMIVDGLECPTFEYSSDMRG